MKTLKSFSIRKVRVAGFVMLIGFVLNTILFLQNRFVDAALGLFICLITAFFLFVIAEVWEIHQEVQNGFKKKG